MKILEDIQRRIEDAFDSIAEKTSIDNDAADSVENTYSASKIEELVATLQTTITTLEATVDALEIRVTELEGS